MDERQTLAHLTPVPFEQAVEAFLLLLRESGRTQMEYVCGKVLKGEWDPLVVKERFERPNPPVTPLSPFDGMLEFHV